MAAEENTVTRADVVVVGAGLSGLAVATYLARAGRRVVVLEASKRAGGRAMSEERDGFTLNLGPHALYRAGAGAAVLAELGVEAKGAPPPARGIALARGRPYRMPFGPPSLISTRLLGVRDKLAVGSGGAAHNDDPPIP